jgi:CIC family chloride channel protein
VDPAQEVQPDLSRDAPKGRAEVHVEPPASGSGPDVRHAAKWFGLAILIGVAAGGASIAFFEALQFAIEWFTHRLAGFHPPVPGGDPEPDRSGSPGGLYGSSWHYLIALVPALGGLLAGLIVRFAGSEAERGGTDAVLDAFHRRGGRFALKEPLVRAASAVMVIGSGGSVGREGPMVGLGAALGSAVASLFKLRAAERRIALLIGAAAGFAAIFRAPLSGAIFAIESPYRNPEFEYPAFVPAIIGSVAAFATFSLFYGFAPVFVASGFALANPWELPLYAVFGLVCALTGVFYVTTLNVLRRRIFDPLFTRLRMPSFLRPAFGGLLLGALILVVPEVWGTGYGWVQQAIDGTLTSGGLAGVLFLLALVGAKALGTGITYGSRGGDGVFGPAFYIGAMVGAGYGQLAHELMPTIVTQPGAYVLVGMSGVFAGITKVPIAGLVMVCEITGSYALLLPLVLVCSIAYVFTGRVSVYSAQVGARFESPAHLGSFAVDVLAPLKVRDALPRRGVLSTLAPDQPLADAIRLLGSSRQQTFPVVSKDREFLGVVTSEEVRDFLFETGVHRLVLVSEISSPSYPVLGPGDPLVAALSKLTAEECDELPIVETVDGKRNLVGLLSRDQILRTYRARLDRLSRGIPDDTGVARPPR